MSRSSDAVDARGEVLEEGGRDIPEKDGGDIVDDIREANVGRSETEPSDECKRTVPNGVFASPPLLFFFSFCFRSPTLGLLREKWLRYDVNS